MAMSYKAKLHSNRHCSHLVVSPSWRGAKPDVFLNLRVCCLHLLVIWEKTSGQQGHKQGFSGAAKRFASGHFHNNSNLLQTLIANLKGHGTIIVVVVVVVLVVAVVVATTTTTTATV
jgi:hypothetical protein